MKPISQHVVPVVEFTGQAALTLEQSAAFKAAGVLVIRGLIKGDELAALQAETLPMVEAARARAAVMSEVKSWLDPYDTAYTRHATTGAMTPFRVEYIINKSSACRRLLAHPFVLRTVALIQGANLTSTWDSMVFKNQGAGAIVPWHRDALAPECASVPLFNVDFYLDQADVSNCVWGIPGSNQWTVEEASADIARRNAGGDFDTTGATPIPMQPGDVLLHDITVLHGSPWAETKLRRVLYYEFRPAAVLIESGSHNEAYCRRKQRMLQALIAERAAHPVGVGEVPFLYNPTMPATLSDLPPGWLPHTFCYPHEDYVGLLKS